jgi:hypothetical protein
MLLLLYLRLWILLAHLFGVKAMDLLSTICMSCEVYSFLRCIASKYGSRLCYVLVFILYGQQTVPIFLMDDITNGIYDATYSCVCSTL